MDPMERVLGIRIIKCLDGDLTIVQALSACSFRCCHYANGMATADIRTWPNAALDVSVNDRSYASIVALRPP